MQFLNKPFLISIGARPSPLSQVQVQEVLLEIRQIYPTIDFHIHSIPTVGDKDLKSSLRDLDKTNFFTKEIDEAVLNGTCRLGIHSAKDLPDPLPKELSLICLTKGLCSFDSLVLQSGFTLDSLPKGALIATSSKRREEMIKKLRDDFTFCDIRGTINQRLAQLEKGVIDGVVIAEAALIRLGFTHLNRLILSEPTVEGQGQLAILARKEDEEMRKLFASIDSRQERFFKT